MFRVCYLGTIAPCGTRTLGLLVRTVYDSSDMMRSGSCITSSLIIGLWRKLTGRNCCDLDYFVSKSRSLRDKYCITPGCCDYVNNILHILAQTNSVVSYPLW